MFDKSKDYLKQTVTTPVTYVLKTAEGQYAAGVVVAYGVRQTVERTSPDWTQEDTINVYLWREPWIAAFGDANRLPVISDRLVVAGAYWTVSEVSYTDMDDSGYHQRYKLTCQRLKAKVPV